MLSRRDFLKLCMSAALTAGLTEQLLPIMRQAFAERKLTKPPVIWLELGSCTGNSVSLDNAVNPTFYQVLHDMIDLRYHWLLNAAQGEQAVQALMDTVEQESGNFWIVVEGSVMTADNGRFNHIFLRGNEMVTGLAALREFAPRAKHVIAVGTCACFGGPAAAYPNPGGAKGVWDVIKQPVINIPGCPSHPDWITGTFSHLLMYGLPQMDSYNRPKMFFGQTIHDLCQRRQQYEDGIFAAFPGEKGCLYKVGCKGPVTHADCPKRQWNHYVNWPVRAGAPCIGCAGPGFPDSTMPFYEHLPDVHTPLGALNVKKIGAAAVGLGAAATGVHFITGVMTRRVGKNWLEGTKPQETDQPENLEQLKQELDDLIRQQNALISESKSLAKNKVKRRLPRTFRKKVVDFFRPGPKHRR
ncbi:hydrogenase small subunit [Sporomusa termitida]|uniref:HydA: hydrogenase (NiFe) small subunit (HydA) n=1 Tax=Sporomusa termitida TaxID=2377 RepID=A0A517DZH1_9FIRM|nr:hydrogenase small subunit [Sporomusa termitida]QDR82749.1 hydA: hydrogenase (NiFe) small subunit (hydA) [Sporomusa termitida]